MQYRKFGRTGVRVSALGFGCMRLPLAPDGTVDEAEAIAMIRRAVDRGVNYIDTAYPYHQQTSERIVGRALREGYREKVYLATKSPMWKLEREEDFEAILEEQLEKLQTDHIDFYLLHALNRERFEEKVKRFRLVDHMRRAREAGKIRWLGFSFHDDLDTFKRIVDWTDQWDFCQIQYNYVNTDHQAGDAGLRHAAGRELGVIVMEPLLGGRLAALSSHVGACFSPDKTAVEHALDFVWDKEEVSLLLSGMSSRQQVEDNLVYADRSAAGMLTEEERAAYVRAKAVYDRMSMVSCTACGYCMPCPFGLNIPELFKTYNLYGLVGKGDAKAAYDALPVRADRCRACRRCEQVCSQHIDVSGTMKKIAALFAE